MRRLYKRTYPKPKPKLRRSQPLMQPEWDDTIHDLTQLRLSPEEQLRRRLQRISKNQWGVIALAKQLKAADEDQLADTDGSQLEKDEAQDSTLQHLGLQSPGSCTTLSNDSEDDMCQYNQPRRMHVWNPPSSRPEDDDSDLQQGRTASCATAAGSQQQHGTTLLVDAGTLQALLAKIETLEAHLVQQQQQQQEEVEDDAVQHQPLHIMQQQHQQQSATDVLLQEQLADSQQQLADLREQFQQHMAHSSTLITRLQAQLQTLLVQLPDGTMPRAMLTLDSHRSGKVAPDAAQQNLPYDVEQTAPHHRIGAAAPANACLPDTAVSAAPWYKSSSSSDNSSSSSRLPIKLMHGLLAPAAITSTGSPQKAKSSPPPTATVGLQSASTGAALHQSNSQMAAGVMSSGAPGAAAVIAEEARLPSYLQMRQSRSLQHSSSAAAIGASSTGLADGKAAAAADVLHGGGAGEGLATTSSKSQGDAALLQTRPVPPPLPADNPAADVAAALSGETAEHWQGLCTSRAAVGRLQRWSDAEQVAPVMSSSQHRRLSALSTSLGLENDLPGLAAVDYGLQEGLPRAAVGRIYTAAGCSEPMEMPPEPRVVLEQLKGNVSLNDHIRAAAALKGCAANAVGATAWWRV